MRLKAEEEARKKLESEKAIIEAEKKKIDEEKQKLKLVEIERKHIENITQDMVDNVVSNYNVSPEIAYRLLANEAKETAQKEKEEFIQKFSQRQAQKEELKSKPFFKELEKDIDDMVRQDPNIDIATAYTYLRGAKLEDLLDTSKKTTEKRVIADIQDRARRKTQTSSESSSDNTSSLSDFGKKAAMFMGLDPREVAKTIKQRNKESGRR